ncbi:MAG: hypothetical protein QXO84_02950 [Candidatus Aenigmatarchaeota archaeon]
MKKTYFAVMLILLFIPLALSLEIKNVFASVSMKAVSGGKSLLCRIFGIGCSSPSFMVRPATVASQYGCYCDTYQCTGNCWWGNGSVGYNCDYIAQIVGNVSQKPNYAYVDNSTLNQSYKLCTPNYNLRVDTSDGKNHTLEVRWVNWFNTSQEYMGVKDVILTIDLHEQMNTHLIDLLWYNADQNVWESVYWMLNNTNYCILNSTELLTVCNFSAKINTLNKLQNTRFRFIFRKAVFSNNSAVGVFGDSVLGIVRYRDDKGNIINCHVDVDCLKLEAKFVKCVSRTTTSTTTTTTTIPPTTECLLILQKKWYNSQNEETYPPVEQLYNFSLRVNGSHGYGYCNYPSGQNLTCNYVNYNPYSDITQGLVIFNGEQYTVTESGLPSNCEPISGLGTFNVNDLNCTCLNPSAYEGCTPGYWRQPQHFDSWQQPYDPSDLFSQTCTPDQSVCFEDAFPGKTLIEILDNPGGSKLNQLGFHTVAALLNSVHPNVNYPLTATEVITMFNNVYPGTDREYESLKNLFESYNELGCPLNGGRATVTSYSNICPHIVKNICFTTTTTTTTTTTSTTTTTTRTTTSTTRTTTSTTTTTTTTIKSVKIDCVELVINYKDCIKMTTTTYRPIDDCWIKIKCPTGQIPELVNGECKCVPINQPIE